MLSHPFRYRIRGAILLAAIALPSLVGGSSRAETTPRRQSAGDVAGSPFGKLEVVSSDGELTPLVLETRPTLYLFWSPLCDPSRGVLKKMSVILAELGDEAPQVVAVSCEKAPAIAGALAELELAASESLFVCKDNFGEAFRKVRARGTPVASVYDQHGDCLGTPDPNYLTKEDLAQIAMGSLPVVPASPMVAEEVAPDAWDVRLLDTDPDSKPMVEIAEVDQLGNFARFDPESGVIAMPGGSAPMLLSLALGAPPSRLIWDDAPGADSKILRVKIVPPDGRLATSKLTLLSAVRSQLGLDWELTTQQREAWVLTKHGTSPPKASDAGAQKFSALGPRFTGVATVRTLATWLENHAGAPVVDKTGYGNQLFDFDVHLPTRRGVADALDDQGIAAEKSESDVEVYRVFNR